MKNKKGAIPLIWIIIGVWLAVSLGYISWDLFGREPNVYPNYVNKVSTCDPACDEYCYLPSLSGFDVHMTCCGETVESVMTCIGNPVGSNECHADSLTGEQVAAVYCNGNTTEGIMGKIYSYWWVLLIFLIFTPIGKSLLRRIGIKF